jgi:hypothetical protein
MGTGVGLPRNVQGIGGVATFTGPDQGKDRVDFKGRSMFVYRERMSGALRIAIDLDGAGTGCKASVINGRQGGKNIVQHILGDAQVEVSSVQVQSVNCSIKEGNVFGNEPTRLMPLCGMPRRVVVGLHRNWTFAGTGNVTCVIWNSRSDAGAINIVIQPKSWNQASCS